MPENLTKNIYQNPKTKIDTKHINKPNVTKKIENFTTKNIKTDRKLKNELKNINRDQKLKQTEMKDKKPIITMTLPNDLD